MKLSYHALYDKPNLAFVRNDDTGLYFARFVYNITLTEHSPRPTFFWDIQWTKQPEAVVELGTDTDIWLREHAYSVENCGVTK